MAILGGTEVAAAVAEASLTNWKRRNDPGRKLPPTLARLRVLMETETFSICNVGPWAHQLERGALTCFVPPYDAKDDREKLGYAKSAPMPVIRREAKILDESEFTFYEDDGRMVANDLIGVGPNMAKANSFLKFGVFVPAGAEPTAEEIAAARKALADYTDELIAEARNAFDSGNPVLRQQTIGPRHLWAAQRRGIDERWVHHDHAEESIRCEMCGKFNPAGIAKCACGTIINVELYKKLQSQQERILEDLTAPHPKSGK